MGGANRFLQGPATHGTFGSPQSLRLTCGNCNSPFSIPSPESQSFGRTHAFTAFLSARGASNAGLITARCPHCHKVTSVGPAFARTHWIGYTVFAIVAIIVAVSVTAGTAEAAKTNNALYFLWSILYLVALVLMSRAVVFMIMPVSSVEVPTLQI
nr:hypotheticial protein [Schistosoma japonicum]